MTTTTTLTNISGDYTIDTAHSRIGFVARHAMVTKVRGQFEDYTATAHVDTENPAASSAEVTINVGSIDTGNADRDGHLRSPDFFDAEKYPTITFRSTDVQRDGQEWTVTGDLTIKDVTKPVTIVFEETGSAVDDAEELVKQKRLADAAIYAKRANASALVFDYKAAAEDYGKAFTLAEKWDEKLRWNYKNQQAEALNAYGTATGDGASMEQAIDRTWEYLGQRKAFGAPLAANDHLRYELAAVSAEVDLLKHYNRSCAEAFVAGVMLGPP